MSHPLESFRNNLLRTMSPEDASLLEPNLEPVTLDRRRVLEKQLAPISHIYFPESGIASTLAKAGPDRRSEVGVFGREGMSGLAVVLGNHRSIYECFMQLGGEGHRVEADTLRAAMSESPTLRLFLLHFAHAFFLQTAYTALSAAQARLEERLCRWLLMCHDRVDGDTVYMTHDFLATMLSVRRAGVTTALHIVEGRGLVVASRGRIEIRDREGLEICANGTYGTPEDEYQRLLGVRLRATRS